MNFSGPLSKALNNFIFLSRTFSRMKMRPPVELDHCQGLLVFSFMHGTDVCVLSRTLITFKWPERKEAELGCFVLFCFLILPRCKPSTALFEFEYLNQKKNNFQRAHMVAQYYPTLSFGI